MTTFNVTRRNGTQSPYDIQKIRKVCEFACRSLRVNSNLLESGMTANLTEGITTKEIQDSLINHALSLFCQAEPDWRIVAGRLKLWALYKNALVQRKPAFGQHAFTSLYNTIQTFKDNYNHIVSSAYSLSDLNEASSWYTTYWDMGWDYAGVTLLENRYLLPGELPQEMMIMTALTIASVEKPSLRLEFAERLYSALAQRKLSLATPLLMNARLNTGNLSSCFITKIEDTLESIFAGITNIARISKNGGGVGVNVSALRPRGSDLMGVQGAANGVLPFVKLINDTALAVNQGGKRAGAVTVSLDIWHLDLLEFLECQHENGDLRTKSFDIFPQLVVCDEFMRRVILNDDFTLLDPHEILDVYGVKIEMLCGYNFTDFYRFCEVSQELKRKKTISARDVIKQIIKSQIETGLPYLAFKDTINYANPNKHDGYIPGVNLCVESFSNVSESQAHTCNLASINLANIELSELGELCSIAVRALDNSIELCAPPFEESKTHNQDYRTIGVGVMGLADWLAKNNLKYTKIKEIEAVFEWVSYFCILESVALAKERGAYQKFVGSSWSKGLLPNCNSYDEMTEYMQINPDCWEDLLKEIELHGIRNSQLTAIAPNTSTALLMGCTSSVLPVFNKCFVDKNANGNVPISPPFLGIYEYEEAPNIHPFTVVKAVAAMQRWVDTGISMELLFNLNDPEINAKTIYDSIVLAWREDIKAIYYIRTVQKSLEQPNIIRQGDCESCAN